MKRKRFETATASNKKRKITKVRKMATPQTKQKMAMVRSIAQGTTEIKYKDEQPAKFGVPITGVMHFLCAIDQGFEQIDRVGSIIYALKLHMKVFVETNTAVTPEIQQLRMIIVQDRQQINSTAPLITELLESPSVVSGINYANKKRWNVLTDQYWSLDKVSNTTNNLQITCPINQEIAYNAALGTSILKGGVYVFFVSDVAAGTPAEYPRVVFRSRLTFTDK